MNELLSFLVPGSFLVAFVAAGVAAVQPTAWPRALAVAVAFIGLGLLLAHFV